MRARRQKSRTKRGQPHRLPICKQDIPHTLQASTLGFKEREEEKISKKRKRAPVESEAAEARIDR
jgi:hypothetical protein